MNNHWTPVLKNLPAKEPLMWVLDTETNTIIDMTPATAIFLASKEPAADMRTLSVEFHNEVALSVATTGEAKTLFEWMKYSGSWHKQSRTTTHAGEGLVLIQVLDITRFDPRSEWLARINLVSQRLELENGKSISFLEFVVLHMLLKGLKHKRIAELLGVTTKTVEYRISRLKIALEVETTEEMMLKVNSSGLIYLALVPIDLDNPAQTELELYKKVIG
jgi:DNA-binding CsgD family transcriptional regulator